MNDIIFSGRHAITMSVSRHAHASWEVIYCTSGSGVLHFDGYQVPYRSNDIVVIPPRLPHFNTSEVGFTNVYINLVQTTLNFPRPTCIANLENELIRPIFDAVFMFYSADQTSNAPLLTSLGNVIATYVTSHQSHSVKNEVVSVIEQHIIQNFTDCDFDLSAYLDTLPFSTDYLIKLFKKDLGTTPHKYLTELRLRSAAEWLSGATGSNISEISRVCGFSEPLYFSRLFKKKFGLSPINYRSRNPVETLSEEADARITLDPLN